MGGRVYDRLPLPVDRDPLRQLAVEVGKLAEQLDPKKAAEHAAALAKFVADNLIPALTKVTGIDLSSPEAFVASLVRVAMTGGPGSDFAAGVLNVVGKAVGIPELGDFLNGLGALDLPTHIPELSKGLEGLYDALDGIDLTNPGSILKAIRGAIPKALTDKLGPLLGGLDFLDDGDVDPLSVWEKVITTWFQQSGKLVTQHDLVGGGSPDATGFPYDFPHEFEARASNPQSTFFDNLRRWAGGVDFLGDDFDHIGAAKAFIKYVLTPAGLLEPFEQFIDQALHAIGLDPIGSLLDKVFDLSDGLDDWFGGTKQTDDHLQDLVKTLFGALTNGDAASSGLGLGGLVGAIFKALQNFSPTNVGGGSFGQNNIIGVIAGLLNSAVGGAVGKLGTGATLADLFNTMFQVSTNAFNGNQAKNVLNTRDNTSLKSGFFPTSITNIDFGMLSFVPDALKAFQVTSAKALRAYFPMPYDGNFNVVRWQGYGNTGITSAFVNIFKMDPLTGIETLVHRSLDIKSLLPGGGEFKPITYVMPSNVIKVAGTDVGRQLYALEVEVIGNGAAHVIGGAQDKLGDQSASNGTNVAVFPKRWAAVRNPNGATPPATIQNPSYTAEVPSFEFGIAPTPTEGAGTVPGSVNARQPETYTFGTPGSSGGVQIPSWCNVIDAAVWASGGSGHQGGGAYGARGAGGGAAMPVTKTWRRGVDFDEISANVLSYSVGAPGGANSGDGNDSHILFPNGLDLYATPGRGAAGFDTSGTDYVGRASTGVTFADGAPYPGGGEQQTPGAAGVSPGGGGAGGDGQYKSGGRGGSGLVIIRFRAA